MRRMASFLMGATALWLQGPPATAQEVLPLAEVLGATHVHGIAPGPDGRQSVTLATHHGLWAVDLAAKEAKRIGPSQDDFMGYSAVPGQPMAAIASGHPATGGNLGVIRTDDGGQSWIRLSDGIGGPVDFHNMEVSDANPLVIYGIGHDGGVQRSADGGATWEITGTAPEKLIDIATAVRDDKVLYAATETGLYRSPDAGATWQALRQGAAFTTVDTGADGVLRAVEYGRGLISLDDTGAEQLLAATVPGGYLLYLGSTHAEPHRLMALSAAGGLVLSDDGGASWQDALSAD